MVTPPREEDLEVLEQGTGSLGPVSRSVRVLVAALLLVAVGAVAVDRQVRSEERVAVDACVQATSDAVAVARGRVSVMAGYVRPTLAGAPPQRLRRQLLQMISSSAGPGVPGLRRARGRCAATDVWPVHSSLRQTVDDCVTLLDGEVAYLGDVAADGLRGFGAGGVARGLCLSP